MGNGLRLHRVEERGSGHTVNDEGKKNSSFARLHFGVRDPLLHWVACFKCPLVCCENGHLKQNMLQSF